MALSNPSSAAIVTPTHQASTTAVPDTLERTEQYERAPRRIQEGLIRQALEPLGMRESRTSWRDNDEIRLSPVPAWTSHFREFFALAPLFLACVRIPAITGITPDIFAHFVSIPDTLRVSGRRWNSLEYCGRTDHILASLRTAADSQHNRSQGQ